MIETFVHSKALVDTSEVGMGTSIWAFTHLMKGVRIGSNCNVGSHCFVESGVTIGDNVTIKNGNRIWEGVTIEDGVFIGPQVVFTNDLYPRSPRLAQAAPRYLDKATWLVPTLVKRGASIGAGAIIIAGTTIGEYARISVGAIVRRDVAAYALVRGCPAEWIRWIRECAQPLEVRDGVAECGACGKHFHVWCGSLYPLDSRSREGMKFNKLEGDR
ncbi:MAG: N-acetyltransferase [Chloroflexota bacterium]|nr:N-acetyltransferase [Chloroflexota bacterium]